MMFSLYYTFTAIVKFILVYIDKIPNNIRKNLFSDAGIYYKYAIQSSEYIICLLYTSPSPRD